jgi:ATP-binding cassette subfamily F protein uup
VVTSTLVLEGDGKIGDYVGGYADWVREKEKVAAAKAAGAARAEALAGAPPAKPKASRKLSNKERGELEALPAQIEAIEVEQAGLGAKLSDPVFYQRERGAASEAKARLDELERRHAVAFARWEELEALRAPG